MACVRMGWIGDDGGGHRISTSDAKMEERENIPSYMVRWKCPDRSGFVLRRHEHLCGCATLLCRSYQPLLEWMLVLGDWVSSLWMAKNDGTFRRCRLRQSSKERLIKFYAFSSSAQTATKNAIGNLMLPKGKSRQVAQMYLSSHCGRDAGTGKRYYGGNFYQCQHAQSQCSGAFARRASGDGVGCLTRSCLASWKIKPHFAIADRVSGRPCTASCLAPSIHMTFDSCRISPTRACVFSHLVSIFLISPPTARLLVSHLRISGF